MQKIRPDLGIGKNIKLMRIARDMTQEQVIAKIQLLGLVMSRGVYSKIENNRMNIRVSELIALKQIFKLSSFDDFFRGLE